MSVWLSHSCGVVLRTEALVGPAGILTALHRLTTPRIPEERVFSDATEAEAAFESEVAFYKLDPLSREK